MKQIKRRFYKINSLLGNTWALFYVIIGARMTGKSYSVTDFLCNQKRSLVMAVRITGCEYQKRQPKHYYQIKLIS